MPPGYGVAWSVLGAGGLALLAAMGLRASEHHTGGQPATPVLTAPSARTPVVPVSLPPVSAAPSVPDGRRGTPAPHPSPAAPNGAAAAVSSFVLAPIRTAAVPSPRVPAIPAAPPFPTAGDLLSLTARLSVSP